jgi:hypothetical protein
MTSEPSLNCRRLSIWQERHDASSFTPAEAAAEILDGFEAGEEEIYVSDMARGITQGLAHDPKAVERQLASPG